MTLVEMHYDQYPLDVTVVLFLYYTEAEEEAAGVYPKN